MGLIRLEDVLQSKLNDTAIGGAGDAAVGAWGVRIGARPAKVGAVQRIEQLRAELDVVGFAQTAEISSGFLSRTRLGIASGPPN